MIDNATAKSFTFLAMGPIASCVYDIGMTPEREMRPLVGRTLKRLLALAGLRRELTVSVPRT